MHDYLLPFGPQHPALIEPMHIKLRVEGEKIVGSELVLGYNHKGVEKSFESRWWAKGVYLSERICGICLPKNEEIITESGDLIRIGDYVEQQIGGQEERFISAETRKQAKIFSLKNSFFAEPGKITHVQRFRSPERILEIRTSSGMKIRSTHAHKIPVDTPAGPEYLRAEQLKRGDMLYSARHFRIKDAWKPLIIDLLPEDFVIRLEKEDLRSFNKKLRERFGTLTDAGKALKIQRTKFGQGNLRNGIMIKECKRACKEIGIEWEGLKTRIRSVSNGQNHFTLKDRYVNEDMMYLIGLIASDGSFGRKRKGGHNDYRLSFVNKERELLDQFVKAYRNLFPAKRIEKRALKSGAEILRISNPILSEAARYLGFRSLGNKREDIRLLFKMPDNLISAFLGGYFDGDGGCKLRNRTAKILIYSKSERFLSRIQMLMKRLGIASALKRRGRSGFKNSYSYILLINNSEDALAFSSRVKNRLGRKRKVLDEIGVFAKKSGRFHSKFQMCPLRANKLFSELRRKENIPLNRFHSGSNLSKIEKGKRINKATMSTYLKELEKLAGKSEGTEEIRRLISNDFHLDSVVSVREIASPSRFVYDLTLNPTHNFIVNGGPVVSNCGHYHTSCYCQGIENLMGIGIPDRAKYVRIIIGELERIHSHMLALGIVAWEIGMDTLFHYMFRDRELVMQLQELLSGNRVHFAMNVIGGVRRDINADQGKVVERKIGKIRERLGHYVKLFRTDSSIRNRVRHVGYLSKRKARELGPVGPNVRASGIDYDVRDTDYLPYKKLKFRAVTGEGGDILERCIVRLKECQESVRIIEEALLTLPKTGLAVKVPPVIKIEEGKETVSRVEAPRGELIYYIRSAGDRPYRVKVRTPTYQTFHIIDEIIGGYEIPDVPPILASIDPCFSCADRMTVIDNGSGKERIVSRQDIKRMREDG